MTGWPSERSRNGGVDEVPLPSGPGRLWLCGKHFVGPDVEAALERVGATTVVCLNEADELAGRYDDYVDWLTELTEAMSGRVVWFPIPDLHAPDVEVVTEFLAGLRDRLDRGEGLLMHCGAGVGRAGTMAVALLITMGVPPAAALATVAAHRPSAGPEAGAQRELIDALAVRQQ